MNEISNLTKNSLALAWQSFFVFDVESKKVDSRRGRNGENMAKNGEAHSDSTELDDRFVSGFEINLARVQH